jgi:hypothetical protein
MKKILLVSVLSVAFLAACGGGNNNGGTAGTPPLSNSVDAQGNCTQAFRDAAVAFIQSGQQYAANKTAENLRDLKTKCDAFRSNHAKAAQCKTTDQNNQVVTVNASEVYEACAKVDAQVGGGAQGGNTGGNGGIGHLSN